MIKLRAKSLAVMFMMWLSGVSDSALGQSPENITSRFYFPGGIGINFPTDNDRASLSHGFLLITALEYRPVYENAWFFRFNYDALTNRYQNISQTNLTNVNTGKLSSSVFALGVGYRKSLNCLKIFGLLQPGWAINSFDKVSNQMGVISVLPVTQKHAALKISAGLEYYLAPHFALTADPSYYWFTSSHQLLNPQSFNISLGFTTTLF